MYDDPRLTPEIVFRIYASRRRLFYENPLLHAKVFGPDDILRPPPCDPPTVLGVIPGPRSVTVVFEPVRKKPADGGATSYVLRVNHACSHVIEMEVENVKDSGYTVTGLPTGRVFTVTVASKNLVGVGSFSAPSDPFLPLPPPKTPPSRGSKTSGKKRSPQNASPMQPQTQGPVPPPAPEAEARSALILDPPRWVRVTAGKRYASVSFENLRTPAVHRGEVSYVLRVRDGSGRDVEFKGITETSHRMDNLHPGVHYTVSVASCYQKTIGRFSRPSAPFTPLPSAGTDTPISVASSSLMTKPGHLHTPNSPPRASTNHSSTSKLNPGPSATSTAHSSIAPKVYGENKSRRPPARPPAPAILGITPGPRRANVRFTEAGASSFVLRLHNLTSGHIREITGVTRSPHTLHGLCNGEVYTLAISARGGGHAAEFSAPSEPFVPSARV